MSLSTSTSKAICFVSISPTAFPTRPSLNKHPARPSKRCPYLPIACTEPNSVPNSPGALLRSWKDRRSISSTVDLSRRFISVLFLSNKCQRAAYAEKQLTKYAEAYSMSRRLLILSAGIDNEPGDLIPWRIISAAKQTDINLSDEKPCALFEIGDLEYYDFVVAVDRNVKERVMTMAESYARSSGGDLCEWERKIRLLCDFDACHTNDTALSSAVPLDVPTFRQAPAFEVAMEIIQSSCERIIKSLMVAGM